MKLRHLISRTTVRLEHFRNALPLFRTIRRLEDEAEELQGQIEELHYEAGIVADEFERDCWKAMKSLLEICGFDWKDVEGSDGVSAWEARDHIAETIRDCRRTAGDQRYMLEAYRQMLGPKGLEVVEHWTAKKMKRVHRSWEPDAWSLTGEERAQLLLDLEAALKTAVPVESIDGHLVS